MATKYRSQELLSAGSGCPLFEGQRRDINTSACLNWKAQWSLGTGEGTDAKGCECAGCGSCPVWEELCNTDAAEISVGLRGVTRGICHSGGAG